MNKCLLLLSLLYFVVIPASAHEVKRAGNVAVLLHMEPQDSPVINEPATLYLSFDDDNKKFSLVDCECKVEIKNGSSTLHSQNLVIQEAFGHNAGSVDFTFPSKGIYTVDLTAVSKTGKFEKINLSYDVRIERESLHQAPVDPLSREQANSDLIFWSIVGAAFICAILLIFIRRYKGNKK